MDIDLKPIFTGDDLRKPFMEPTTCMALCHILTRPILTSPHEESAKAQVTTPILQMRELRHIKVSNLPKTTQLVNGGNVI